MFQEEGVDGGQDTTWSSLILVNAVFELLVEEETLFPGIVQMSFAVFEQQVADFSAFITRYVLFAGVLSYL